MDKVKTDRGFKAERNLDVKDDEFYDYMETSAYGELIRLENLLFTSHKMLQTFFSQDLPPYKEGSKIRS